ncbi:amino acid adenylation domain-containing protein [Streptomyces sp. Li-HN-5-11]|uniref:amino acid adenylation domain-containing protein n=1 Tax=Streptomyces sp. Li-HN-5-11 TaxID=3075432 RepID=UPI0028A6EA61|nr:amino acid adenylation domain-containing protein [Streptomyces sp. Li-HN-5-11]WNM31289.1 amino acid adenylation domain-containing protein [Streptomyces sp. Li-HN-5-11]
MRLHQLVIDSARRAPDAPAVRSSQGVFSYRELDELADRYAAALHRRGVRPGDRVVLWTHKTLDAIALMQGTLRVGAVYVPVSANNPAARVRRIAAGCTPALVVADADGIRRAAQSGWEAAWPLASFDEVREEAPASAAPPVHGNEPDEPAYILYTSGSTGEPKGVCISHRNALAFVRWAVAEVGVTAADRLSNHAPFNFDLSVFDLYATFLAGACVVLVPEGLAYDPAQLAALMHRERISVWYSVPSALILMMQRGDLLAGDPPEALRACVFAGEPFPVQQVHELRKAWPDVRMFNWYGPTETNVCTSYEVTDRDLGSTRALPIGAPASGDRIRLHPPRAREGEIVVSGPTVMLGYWGREPQRGPYFTGDIGRMGPDGMLEYVGRRDHMVKVRGHRIELGDIEAVVAAHPRVAAAACVVVGSGLDASIHAVVVPEGPKGPGLLELKRDCADRLPLYMVVDAVHTVDELPLTPNGKTDRQALLHRITAVGAG